MISLSVCYIVQTVHDAKDLVTFSVISGSGRLAGTHNGYVASHRSSSLSSVNAYHGLARAVVFVTSAAALPATERNMLAYMDIESDLTSLEQDNSSNIVVQASSPGLGHTELTIPVSTEMDDSVLAVASNTAGKPVHFMS